MEKILSLKFNWMKFLSVFFFILLLSAYTHIFSFFSPGSTLDPNCLPGVVGCTVSKPTYTASDVGLSNVPNLSFSGSNTGDETTASIKSKLGITTLSGVNTGDQDLSNLALKSTTINGHSLTNNINISPSDIGLSNVPNLSFSGSNTGDETTNTIKTKLGYASSSTSGYLTNTDWTIFNTKQPAGSYLTSYTETDPVWTAVSANYYTKSNLQTSGLSSIHFDNLTNKPTTLAGYGITDASPTSGSTYYIQNQSSSPQVASLNINGGGTFSTLTASSIKITSGATDGYFLKSDANGNGTWTPIAASQVFKGTWDASTNTPTLTDGVGTAGWDYRVVVSGTWNTISFNAGDDISYNGSIWQRIPGQGFILQTASPTVLGGVKIGTGISIDGSGIISVSTSYESPVSQGTTAEYYRGDKTWATLNATSVGLGNVTNESKITMFTNPTFTGTVSGITPSMVSLGNVTNESKATMFTNPTFTGTVSGITASMVGAPSGSGTSTGSNTGDNAPNSLYSGLSSSKQDALSGTGFVKISGSTISYDNSTYVTGTPWTSMGYVTGTPWTSLGYLTTETDPNIYAWAKSPTKPVYTPSEVSLGNVTNESKITMFTNPTFTGTTTVADISTSGNITPTVTNTQSLGSSTKVWKDLFVGNGSIYVNGQEVLQTDVSNSVVVSASNAQNLIMQTSGGGNIELNPAVGAGQILLKSDISITGGKKIKTSDSTAVIFNDGISSLANISATGTILGSNLSGTNTGDETLSSIKTKLGITTLSGSNTGDQTNITGNAGTVTNGLYSTGTYSNPTWLTAVPYSILSGTVPTWNQSTTGSAATLTTPRTIAGVSFDGSSNISLASTNLSDSSNIARLNAANTFTNTGVTSFAGNVGVGTTSPLFKLSIDAGSSNNGILLQSTTGQAQIQLYQTDATSGQRRIQWQNYGGKSLIRTLDDTGVTIINNLMAFDLSTGNVGIGTVSPGAPLEVKGSYLVNQGTLNVLDSTAYTTGVGGRIALRGYYGPNAGDFATYGLISGVKMNSTLNDYLGGIAFSVLPASGTVTEAMRINNLGNVGIGTTSPGQSLDVNGNIRANNAVMSDYYLNTSNNAYIAYRSGTNTFIGNSGTFVSQDTGNVGIGTTSPGNKLTVDTNIANQGTGITLQNSNTGGWGQVFNSALYGYNGSPAGMFNVLSMQTRYDGTTGSINFMTQAQPQSTPVVALSLQGAGNVGIGTTNPGQKLEVSGTIRQTGCTTAGGLSANASGDIICTPSSIQFKNTRTNLTDGLATLVQLQPVSYIFNSNMNMGHDVHYGFISEEVNSINQALATHDGNEKPYGLDTNAILAVTVNSIKELNLKVEDLNTKIGSGATMSNMVADFFGGVVTSVSDGVAYMKDLVVGTLKVGSPVKRTGITLFDEITGDPYCISVSDGQTQTTQGECGVIDTEKIAQEKAAAAAEAAAAAQADADAKAVAALQAQIEAQKLKDAQTAAPAPQALTPAAPDPVPETPPVPLSGEDNTPAPAPVPDAPLVP